MILEVSNEEELKNALLMDINENRFIGLTNDIYVKSPIKISTSYLSYSSIDGNNFKIISETKILFVIKKDSNDDDDNLPVTPLRMLDLSNISFLNICSESCLFSIEKIKNLEINIDKCEIHNFNSVVENNSTTEDKIKVIIDESKITSDNFCNVFIFNVNTFDIHIDKSYIEIKGNVINIIKNKNELLDSEINMVGCVFKLKGEGSSLVSDKDYSLNDTVIFKDKTDQIKEYDEDSPELYIKFYNNIIIGEQTNCLINITNKYNTILSFAENIVFKFKQFCNLSIINVAIRTNIFFSDDNFTDSYARLKFGDKDKYPFKHIEIVSNIFKFKNQEKRKSPIIQIEPLSPLGIQYYDVYKYIKGSSELCRDHSMIDINYNLFCNIGINKILYFGWNSPLAMMEEYWEEIISNDNYEFRNNNIFDNDFKHYETAYTIYDLFKIGGFINKSGYTEMNPDFVNKFKKIQFQSIHKKCPNVLNINLFNRIYKDFMKNSKYLNDFNKDTELNNILKEFKKED